jgi:hypothetical protein
MKTKMKTKTIMKPKVIPSTILAALLLLAGGGCANNSENAVVYPFDVETIDFEVANYCSLDGQNLTRDSVYIINSADEYYLYFFCCLGDQDVSQILENPLGRVDFEQYSLLLVWGGATYGIVATTNQLQQLSINEYKLNIDITLNYTAFPATWKTLILTPKLPPDAIITLNKTQHH